MTKHDWWRFVNTPCGRCGKRPAQHTTPLVAPTSSWFTPLNTFELTQPAYCPNETEMTLPPARRIRAPFTTEQHLELGIWARTRGIHKRQGTTHWWWKVLRNRREKRAELGLAY